MVVKGAVSCMVLAMVAANDVTTLLQHSTIEVANEEANEEIESQDEPDCSSTVALLEEHSNSSRVISPAGKEGSRPSWEGPWLGSGSSAPSKDKFMPGTLTASQSMLSAVVTGQQVDQKEILALALEKAGDALQNVLTKHPITQAVKGVLFAFLGSVLGEDEDMEQDDFYDMIIDEVKDMILKDRIRNKLIDVLHSFQDEMRKRDFLMVNYPDQYPLAVQNHDDEGTAIMYQRRIFNYQCWIGKHDHADCAEWEKNGAVVLGVRFAHWHLQTLTEIAANHRDTYNSAKKRDYIQRIWKEGKQYVVLLQHSWQTWYDEWKVKLNDITMEDDKGQKRCETYGSNVLKNYHNCLVKTTGDDYAWPGCPKSRVCRHSDNKFPWKSWIQSWKKCIEKNKRDKYAYINSVKSDIDKLDALQRRAWSYIGYLNDNDD